MADAQRCRPGAPAPRLAVVRAVTARRAGPRRRRRGHARGPRLRRGPAPAAPARARGRATTSRSLVRGLALVGARARRPGRRRWPASRPTRRSRWTPARPSALLAAAHRRRSPLRAVRRAPGDRPVSALRRRQGLTYRYPDAAAAGAARRRRWRSSQGELVVSPGLSGGGKSTLLRAAVRPRAALPRRRVRGPRRGRRAGHARARPGRARRGRAGRCSRTPRRRSSWARCAPSSPSRWRTAAGRAAAVARGVEEAALALGIAHLLDRPTAELSGGELQRVALGAALAGRPQLVAARRADLAARPGRRRRADLAAAPPQRGVGDDRRSSPSTASSAASPPPTG